MNRDQTYFEQMGVHNHVRQITGRYHVSTPFRQLIRQIVADSMGKNFWTKTEPIKRRYFIWSVCTAHIENRQLYRDVMRGNIS